MTDGTSVGSLYYELTIGDKNLDSQLDNADKKVGSFADSLKNGLNKAAAGFAVVGAGLTVIAKQSTDFAVTTVKNAKALGAQIGTTTEEASRLTAALGRMDISAESASAMFGIFSKNIVAATKDFKDQSAGAASSQLAIEKTQRAIADINAEIKKNGDSTGDLNFKLKELNSTLATQQAALNQSTNAFQKLGLTTVDEAGNQKDFGTILFEVADKFKDLPNGIDKTSLAMELFGRSGKDMIKVLNLGSDGIKDLEQQADKLGLTLTSKNIGAVNDYVQSQKELKASTDSLKLAIGTTTAPVLTEFNKKLNDTLLSLIAVDSPFRSLTINIIAFGGPLLTAAAGITAFAANLVTAWPAIVATTTALWGMGAAVIAATWPFVVAGAAIAAAAYLIISNWQTVKDFLQGVWDWVTNNWPYLLGALAGPFGLAVALVVTHLDEIKNAVKNAASDAGHWLYDAGKSIVQGLINGIKDKIGDAVNAVKGAGKSIINAARDVLDWHSPSKVFVGAGKAISQGLALGINSGAGLAHAAINSLTSSIIAPAISVSPALAGATGGSGTSYGDTIVSIGQVNDKSDADYILNHMDRNQDLELNGISPQKGN